MARNKTFSTTVVGAANARSVANLLIDKGKQFSYRPDVGENDDVAADITVDDSDRLFLLRAVVAAEAPDGE